MIDWSAFLGCTGLTSVTIPDGLEVIGDSAFLGCTNLTSVTIPDSVTSIVGGAFKDCTKLTDIIIPESVTTIGNEAFSNCIALANITIPSNVETMGGDAFYGCTALENVVISEGVKTIGARAFGGCTNLTDITIPSSVTKISGAAFYNCTALESIIIPEGVKTIGGSAFYGCTNLTDIIIPSMVTTIDKNSFRDCTGLTSVTIPDSIIGIEDSAFRGCTELESITIPDSVKWISSYAFADCTKLNEIIIPDSINWIDKYAFSNCENLTIYCYRDSFAHRHAAAYAIDYVLILPPTTRLQGNNRVTTANTIALQGWPTGSSTVILASGASFADALAAAPLAAHYDAPILLTSSKPTLEETVLSTINALKAENIIIIGGASSVSKAIHTQLEGLNLKVERLAGGNRYTTAIEVAKALEADGLEFTSAFLADGTNFPDALSVSPVAGILQQPILFTNKGDAAKVNDDTGKYIQSTGIRSVDIVGGGISDTVADNLKSSYGVASTKRLSGSNRYATAVAINTEYKSIFTGGAVTLTTGTNYPDALAGSAYSAKIGAPLFLLQNGQTLGDVQAAIKELAPANVYIYGGAVDDATVNNHI
jgi:putative cell wall-binding protein